MTGDEMICLLGRAHTDLDVVTLLSELGLAIRGTGREKVGDDLAVELDFVDGKLEVVSFGQDFKAIPHGLTWESSAEEVERERAATRKEIQIGGGEPGGVTVYYDRDGLRVTLMYDFGVLVLLWVHAVMGGSR